MFKLSMYRLGKDDMFHFVKEHSFESFKEADKKADNTLWKYKNGGMAEIKDETGKIVSVRQME